MDTFRIRTTFFLVCATALLYLVSPRVYAQERGNADSFDAVFALLDAADTETGILANKGFFYHDPRAYDGTVEASPITAPVWSAMFAQLRRAAANPARFPDARHVRQIVESTGSIQEIRGTTTRSSTTSLATWTSPRRCSTKALM